MPAVGDQHKPNGPVTANPFEDQKLQITAYTAAEIATLQARLDKQLGPEFISSRPGASGQKVHYLAGEKVINLANEVFGFNGWSSAIQNIQIDFVDEHPQTGKISLGLSVIVRVTLKDGTHHEDIGYGHIENCKGKAAAFAKAKKEGTTDALKRALRTFGNVLGNCVYDKEFLGRVTKMKLGRGKWDETELHRHPDFVPVTKEEAPESKAVANMMTSAEVQTDLEEGFDIADFDDTEFGDDEFGDPDQFVITESGLSAVPHMGPPVVNGTTTPSKPPNARVTTAPADAGGRATQAVVQANHPPRQRITGAAVQQQTGQNIPQPMHQQYSSDQQQKHGENHNPSSPSFPSQHFSAQPNRHLPSNLPPPPASRPVAAFYSARAAHNIDADNNLTSATPNTVPRFNPHAESPSIRKTAGVDHKKSVPLRRDVLAKDVGIVPGQAGVGATMGKDFVDPRLDHTRKVGLPGGQTAPSPIGKAPPGGGFGTSAYRPPTRKGPETNPGIVPGGVDRALTGAKRPPLGDVSNVPHPQHSVATADGDERDPKRARINGPGAVSGGLPGQVQGSENASVGADAG